jgi:hypothetical protein
MEMLANATTDHYFNYFRQKDIQQTQVQRAKGINLTKL